MVNLDSTLGAEQMESTPSGKCVSPTSWSGFAFGNQLNKMPFFPWRRYKQFFEKSLVVVIGGFTLQYFCNDLNGAVQRQGYGVITFVPYIVLFSMLFAVFVFWCITTGRRPESRQGLETLPRHRQDIQMNEIQQPTQEIQRNETLQAGGVQMDQALQGFSIRQEEFCSLMDCWFKTRLGEMTRDEALGVMKQLVELRNWRSRDISTESTADETRAVMNESLETRGDGSRRRSAGSIVDGPHDLAFPVLCPRATESNSQARSLSHDGLVLKIPQNVNVGELGEIYDANLPGCRELHRRIEIGSKDGHLRKFLASQILGSLRMAWTLDKDSTIQLGSFAIFKYTDSGVKCWMLQEGWTPTIFDIHRSSRNFFEILTGERAIWTVRGVNLRDATLRVATTEKSKTLTNSHHFKTENGVDVVLFKEPPSLPMFLDRVYISASNIVKVEEGVPLKLHSQAIKVQRAFWISVVDGFIPKPWTLGKMTILSLLFHYFVAGHFAIVLAIIVTTYVYLLHDLVLHKGPDVPIGGLAPMVEEFSNVPDSNSRTLSEGKLAEIDTPIGQKVTDSITSVTIGGLAPVVEEFSAVANSNSRTIPEGKLAEMDMAMEKQGGPDEDEGSTPPFEDSSSHSKSSTPTHDAKMGIGTLKTESITNSSRQAPGKLKTRRKRPCKKPPTQIIEASPDQFRATVQELTGMKPAMSVPRGQPVVDNPLHRDSTTPVTIGGLAPVVEEFSKVANPNSRTIPERKLAEMDMAMEKQGGDLPIGAKEEVIELKTPQQRRAAFKNKYVPQAHELSEPKEPTLMSRSGTGISDGDFEGRTRSAQALSSIPARMTSQSVVVDDLTKTDEPIDKQPSRVSSPSTVGECFTTTDEAIDKQGGDLTVDSMFDPDHWSVDPITYETMCDPVKCNDGVTYDRWTIINNGIRRSPIDRSLTTFYIACDDVDARRRLFRELPKQEGMFRRLRETYREKALQSARALDCEDAIEMLNNVLVWAPSDAECKTELDRVLTLVNEGSSSLDRQPQKSNEPSAKQPSRVSSPSGSEEGFTTTDKAIDKQGGGLPGKKGKEQKNLTELQVLLLKELKQRGPTRTLELAKIVGLVTGGDVNPFIYDLEKRNLVVKVNNAPPVWQLNEPGMKKSR